MDLQLCRVLEAARNGITVNDEQNPEEVMLGLETAIRQKLVTDNSNAWDTASFFVLTRAGRRALDARPTWADRVFALLGV